MQLFTSFFLKFMSNLLMKGVLFLLNAAEGKKTSGNAIVQVAG
jgi:hypothetical protein